MSRPTIFLDDGGVMNDNEVRAPQWQRLLGEFFPPRLGGTAASWEEANRETASRVWTTGALESQLAQAAGSYAAFDRIYKLDWLRGMVEYLGFPMPPDDAAFELADQATAYVTCRVNSAFPGAVDAIVELHRRGHRLFTASNEASPDLDGYLTAMGVRDLFDRLYGPDLIGMMKLSPVYYERIFAETDVTPADAIVLDDSPDCVAYATAAGATAFLVGAREPLPPGVRRITALAELPHELERLGLP